MGFIFKPHITNMKMLNCEDQTFFQLGKPQNTIKEIFEVCLNFSITAWYKLKYHPHHMCSCLSIFFWEQMISSKNYQLPKKEKTKQTDSSVKRCMIWRIGKWTGNVSCTSLNNNNKKSREYLVGKKPNLLKDSQVTEFIVSLHSGATRQIQDLQIH